MEEFRATNVDVLARDKSHLVSLNNRLAQELRDAEALNNGLQKEKNEWQVAINEWEVALQNESAKTQALTLQIGECQHQISALTFKLGRKASDHQASKLQIATSHLTYHDQVGFPQHPPAYQSEGVYYQQPYQQSPQKET
jgi:phenylalanyl-tRNA synthetase alpha subunit